MDHRIRNYSVSIGVLYVAMVLTTWLLFGEDITLANAFTGSLVYVFYLAIVFGAVTLASVVAYMLKREHDATLHHQ